MKKGEIWQVELPSTNGYEQSGERPVIVLSEGEANICIVVPVTSNLQALRFINTIEIEPSEQNRLKEISIALVFQIRAIDKKRLKEKVGVLENSVLDKIDSILKKLLIL